MEPSVDKKGTQHPGIADSLGPIAIDEPVVAVAADKSVAPLPAVPPSAVFLRIRSALNSCAVGSFSTAFIH